METKVVKYLFLQILQMVEAYTIGSHLVNYVTQLLIAIYILKIIQENIALKSFQELSHLRS